MTEGPSLPPNYQLLLRFLPRPTRRDLIDLYNFVGVELTDTAALDDLKKQWQKFCHLPMAQLSIDKNDTLHVQLVKQICRLKITYQFDEAWIEAFLDAREVQFKSKSLATMDELLRYMYGKAEVIGLMTTKILRLPKRAAHAASMQARAIQYLLFLCSLKDDAAVTTFFPKTELAKYNLRNLNKTTIEKQSTDFIAFVQAQLQLYDQWQRVADRGLIHVPKRIRPNILTAIDGYKWVARQIEKDPMVLTRQKLQPSKRRLYISSLIHALD